jgi:hypothetical protein
MNIWMILKISPTRDIKEIKRAYARELKITKPDEDPIAFQALYQAYQQALGYANQDESERDEFVQDIDNQEQINNSETTEENIDPSTEESQIELEKEHQLRITEYERIIAEVKNLLERHEVDPTSLQSWYFIAQSPYILEDRFNWFLGKEIFKLFVEYQKQKIRSRKRYRSRKISYALLDFCDCTFSWNNNTHYLNAELGEDFCRPILMALDDPLLEKYNMGLRGGDLVMAPEKSTAPTKTEEENENSVGCVTVIQILFFIVAIMNIIKHMLEK